MGKLSLVSTPIGNLDDITIRAIKVLFSADIIACEDTRRTGLLCSELKKRHANFHAMAHEFAPRYIRFDDKTEQSHVPFLIEKLQQGKNVALVSDAGTPLISDPGYILVNEAIKRGITVESIPGPTAAIAALTVSGLPTNKFLFLGYPPEKSSHRNKLFTSLPKNTTIIFYCAPHKLQQTLEDMKGVLGDIEITIARELTKIHEELWRGTLSNALTHFSKPQGEFVILFRIA
jgi:16S rRNA (cytidine1402-2'-O)-methyltransferase